MADIGTSCATPMLTASDYRESTKFPDTYDPSKWYTRTLSLRYDFGKSSAVKIQFDRLVDRGAVIPGTAKLISASYDVVF